MSEGLIKMWFSLAAMGFMFLSVIFVYFSRYKLKGVLKAVVTSIAFILLVLAGIIIFFVVFSGPISD